MTRRHAMPRDAAAPRGGVGAVVALVALTAALAWDAWRGSVCGVTKLNNPYTQAQEVDR